MGKAFQGKGLNKIAKYLLLQYIFEEENFVRVEFRTRGSNLQSQRALEKIGATREGLFRKYFVENGVYQDVIFYSILHTEWPDIKKTIFELN
ncbi:Acetyltransferase (GNAT) domain-containing protein [Chitinophaga sp. CF118]|nr:Acetyltransferase (GNAT) domain-containing protein [Chitinophaga sp. CF118]